MHRFLFSLLFSGLASLSISVCAQQSISARASHAASPASISVIAAESVYGDVLKQLGGKRVEVTNIMSQPALDPHFFEVNAEIARRLSKAKLVVYNGAAYDPWVTHLLEASSNLSRQQIVVAKLVGKGPHDNPHLWYLPASMPMLAQAVHTFLLQTDPAHQSEYRAYLADFLKSLAQIDAKIASLRTKYQGLPIAATEPIFDYMAQAIGLQNRHQRLQLAVMNGTEPSAADFAAFADDLRQRRIKLLIYNQQTSPPIAQRLLALAQQAGVAVLYVTETLPVGLSYQAWMLAQLDELDHALEKTLAPSLQ